MAPAMRLMRRLLLLAIWTTGSAWADTAPEFEPVVRIFSGIAYADHDMIRSATTTDFLLLEVGEVWDLAYLLSVVMPSESTRENHFGVISVERFEGAALVNYWNKAVISAAGKETVLAWLESVVVVQTGAGWKLKQMHSTRIEPASLPPDIELTRQMLPPP